MAFMLFLSQNLSNPISISNLFRIPTSSQIQFMQTIDCFHIVLCDLKIKDFHVLPDSFFILRFWKNNHVFLNQIS